MLFACLQISVMLTNCVCLKILLMMLMSTTPSPKKNGEKPVLFKQNLTNKLICCSKARVKNLCHPWQVQGEVGGQRSLKGALNLSWLRIQADVLSAEPAHHHLVIGIRMRRLRPARAFHLKETGIGIQPFHLKREGDNPFWLCSLNFPDLCWCVRLLMKAQVQEQWKKLATLWNFLLRAENPFTM